MSLWQFVRFGLIDNGILVILGLMGTSLEEPIEKALNWCIKKTQFHLDLKKPALFGLFCGALANAISDCVGGIGIPGAPSGTFIGCMVIAIGSIPFIFKLHKNHPRRKKK